MSYRSTRTPLAKPWKTAWRIAIPGMRNPVASGATRRISELPVVVLNVAPNDGETSRANSLRLEFRRLDPQAG